PVSSVRLYCTPSKSRLHSPSLHDALPIFTIHGLEPASEVPYAHADHLSIQVKIIALFSGEIGLHYAGLERPVIHIMDTQMIGVRSEEHTSELQSRGQLVCRLLLEKKIRPI